MNGNIAIFWPMIVQGFLTLLVYVFVVTRRGAAVKAGEARRDAFRIPAGEPATSAAAVRNLANQFELPVLFYVVCLALYITNGASWLAVVVAWIFAVSRLVHAAIHLGPNTIALRMPAFAVGVAAVAVLWIILAVHVANIGAVLSPGA
ncbi:MAPEG family protein [Aureimonas glaciei]|uniref:Membrane protein n=1 Tax=Aureimonas glaciei TaxID=1776957 RepID=A0A916Y8I7_9HYPH|nr:MAPEG family protein [Aureimonas glaciei]GGD35222.1 membrane protein [Aureimonas glaciei]